jgi:acetyl esterase/lipase
MRATARQGSSPIALTRLLVTGVLLAAATGATAVTPAIAAAEPFSIEEVLSAPVPSDLVAAAPALARRSSPLADLDGWRSPVMLVHGDDDRNVLFIQTTDLVQRLRERGVEVGTLIFPDEVHGFLRWQSWVETFRRASDFFDRYLLADAPR